MKKFEVQRRGMQTAKRDVCLRNSALDYLGTNLGIDENAGQFICFPPMVSCQFYLGGEHPLVNMTFGRTGVRGATFFTMTFES